VSILCIPIGYAMIYENLKLIANVRLRLKLRRTLDLINQIGERNKIKNTKIRPDFMSGRICVDYKNYCDSFKKDH